MVNNVRRVPHLKVGPAYKILAKNRQGGGEEGKGKKWGFLQSPEPRPPLPEIKGWGRIFPPSTHHEYLIVTRLASRGIVFRHNVLRKKKISKNNQIGDKLAKNSIVLTVSIAQPCG